MRKPLLSTCGLLTALALSPALLTGAISFTSDFSGGSPWNFDSLTDPEGQVGGTGQFEYSFAATNGASFVEAALPLASFSETGTITASGQVDLGSFQFGNSDFSRRTFLEIGTSDGNKSDFDGTGVLYQLGLTGFNNAGEFRFSENSSIVFDAGSRSRTGSFTVPTGDTVYDFEAIIDVTGDDTSGWTVSATTTYTNATDGTISTSSSFTSSDSGFDGLQSVDKVRFGLETGGGPTSGTFIGDDLSVVVVPEPSSYALVLGGAALLGLLVRRRKSRRA